MSAPILSSKRLNRSLIPQLTGVRFLLAVWVVLYHESGIAQLHNSITDQLPWPLFNLLRIGYLAVPVFFVLSGFVLAYTYSPESKLDYRRYWFSRLARIYPTYLVGILLLLPIGLPRLFASAQIDPKQFIVLMMNLFCMQAWVPQLALTWNAAAWSISVEVLFYALFPFIGILLWRVKNTKVMLGVVLGLDLLPAVFCLAFRLPGFVHVNATESLPVTALTNFVCYNPLLRLPEFAAGILLARLFVKQRSLPSWFSTAALIASTGFIATIAFSAQRLPYILVHNGLLTPLACCLIWSLANENGSLIKWLGSRTLTFLGSTSYAIYIVHVPAMIWFIRLGLTAAPYSYVLCLLMVICLGMLVHVFVEEPARIAILKLSRKATHAKPVSPFFPRKTMAAYRRSSG